MIAGITTKEEAKLATARAHLICADHPNIERLFGPRKYRQPSSHSSLSNLLLEWAIIMEWMRVNPYFQRDNTFQSYVVAMLLTAEQQMPTWFVGHEFLQAIAKTDPPTMPMNELHLPRSAMLFMLPHGTQNIFGSPLTHLFICLAPAQGLHSLVIDHLLRLDASFAHKSDVLYIVGRESLLEPPYKGITWGVRTPYTETLKTSEVCKQLDPEIPLDLAGPADEFSLEMIHRVAINLLLMLAEPSMVQTNTLLVPAQTTGKGSSKKIICPSLWEPKWVGLHYRLPKNYMGGSHASPIMHWRKGHWRNQKYGPGTQLTKRVWISPVLVAKDKTPTPIT